MTKSLTPTSVKRASFGSKVVLKTAFSDLDDGDGYTSGISGQIWGYTFQRTDNPSTQASVGCAVSESSGVFTFYPAEDNTAGDLYIYIDG